MKYEHDKTITFTGERIMKTFTTKEIMKKLISMICVVALILSVSYIQPANAATKKKQSPKITVEKITVNKGYKKSFTPITVENAVGKVTYSFADESSKKMFTIKKASGAMTVKKAVKQGVYKVKVNVSAKGDSSYKSFKKTVTVKITVNPKDKGSVWTGNADISWFTGDKTEYDIYTADELAGFAKIVNSKTDEFGNLDDCTINLMSDIVLNDTTDWEKWSVENPADHVWTPIGKLGNIITGTKGCLANFNGNNHTIRGLFYSGENNCGVFGYAAGIYIRDLNIEKSVIISTNQTTRSTESGALVGLAINCLISNCNVNNVRIDGQSAVGGLIGKTEDGPEYMWMVVSFITGGLGFLINPIILQEANENGGIKGTCISDCSVKNAVLRSARYGSTSPVGGLVGNFDSDGIIAGCSTNKTKCLSINLTGIKGQLNKTVRIDFVKEDEENGISIGKGACGAVIGQKSDSVKVKDCTFSKFSRLDNCEDRSDSEYIK